MLLVAWTCLAIYGSLVPFWFEPRPLDAALSQFAEIRYLSLGVASRSDFVANILLFLPLGFTAMGALCLDRPSRAARVASSLGVALAGIALAIAIEFTQIFFPPRTVSINDIVAEGAGTLGGIVLWWLLGQPGAAWVRRLVARDTRASRLEGWLMIYAAGFVLWQLMPFDVTIRPAELLLKAREGRLTLVPFSEFRTDVLKGAWNLAADTLLWMPVGVLVAVSARRGRVSAPAVALTGAAAGACLETLQLFVFTRYTDATDIISASAGTWVGAWVAERLVSGRLPSRPDATPARPASLAVLGLRRESWWLAALLWLVPLLWYHWYPFDFEFSRAALARHPHLIFSAPFASYYWSPEFHALSTVMRKMALAAPLGFALAAAGCRAGRAHRWWRLGVLAGGAVLFASIEFGQLFLPERVGDITDVLIALAGMWAGVLACAAFGQEETPR